MKVIRVEHNSGYVKEYEDIVCYEFKRNYLHLKRVTETKDIQEIYIPIFNIKEIFVEDEEE